MNNLYDFTPSNTLTSATFDVLKIDGVEDPLINVNKLATLDLEESYFADAINFINEMRDDYTSHKIVLYHSISEASTEAVVLESFSDFFVKVKEIIDKFLKFIKSLFQRFITSLNKMISSEKYLEKHKKDFSDFKDSDKFSFEGYNYTFSDNIPSAQAILSFNNDLFKDLYSETDNLTLAGVKSSINAMDPEDHYSKYRAQVIGRENENIYITDFADELFKLYRNDETMTSTIEVNRSYIKIILERFFKHKQIESNINKQYKQIESAYKQIENQIKDIVKRNGDLNAQAFLNRLPTDNGINKIDSQNINGLTMSGELMTQLDIYVKAKCEQIQECSNIHTLAFSAKLDALKECAKQDRNTLYTALSRIQRTDTKRKEN